MTGDSPFSIHGRLVASTAGVASCSLVGAIVGACAGVEPFNELVRVYEGMFDNTQQQPVEVEKAPVEEKKVDGKIEMVPYKGTWL